MRLFIVINFLFSLSWDDLENNLSLKDAVVSSLIDKYDHVRMRMRQGQKLRRKNNFASGSTMTRKSVNMTRNMHDPELGQSDLIICQVCR